jgi:hypothetical protein
LMMWAGNIIDDTPVLELGKESFMCHFEAWGAFGTPLPGVFMVLCQLGWDHIVHHF